MRDALRTAVALQRQGQWGPAAEIYTRVLSHEPANASALHLLGLLHHERGDQDRAAELIGRAIALRPGNAAYHANLAEVYRLQGQLEKAIESCEAALRLRPEYPEAASNLGLALQALGRLDEAAEQFRRAIALRPNFAQAHSNLGIVLRERREAEQALKHFRKAVELNPRCVAAQTNLGQMLVQLGQPDEALPYCEEAVRLQGDLAQLHHNLGSALHALDRPAEAQVAYLESLRLDPGLAETHDSLGLIQRAEGHWDAALARFQRATELAPDKVSCWEHLADLHDERDEADEAIPCWQRVVELVPERGEPHLALGWSLQIERRFAEAREHYQTAMTLQSDLARAQLRLGGLHEELGDMDDAEAAFREALRLKPMFPLPRARLATLLRGKLSDDDLAALEERLADPKLEEEPRSALLFGLAHVLDAREEYTRAAECLREGNALKLAMAERRHRDYDAGEHEQFIDRLIGICDADFFARFHDAGHPSRRPVFVFGLPRSGTTLVEQILASHSQIHGAGELQVARDSLRAIPAAVNCPDRRPLEVIDRLDAPAIHVIAERHLERLNSFDAGAFQRIVDKMPGNYMHLGLLTVLFPSAVFIHCRRDLRDVAVSCWMTDFASIRWANDPEHLAGHFRQYRRLMDHWTKVLPVSLVEVEYEQTVADLEPVARRLIDACGLAWEPACLDFHRTERPVRTASVTQVRQPIYTRSVARWKHYENELAEIFAQSPLNESARCSDFGNPNAVAKCS